MNYVVVTVFNHVHVYIVPRRVQFNTAEEFRRVVTFSFSQFLVELPLRTGITSLAERALLQAAIRESIFAGKSYNDYVETLLEGQ